ncbi:MAG: hypothetical protein R3Y16_01370 [Rikenellaceae bacterium]
MQREYIKIDESGEVSRALIDTENSTMVDGAVELGYRPYDDSYENVDIETIETPEGEDYSYRGSQIEYHDEGDRVVGYKRVVKCDKELVGRDIAKQEGLIRESDDEMMRLIELTLLALDHADQTDGFKELHTEREQLRSSVEKLRSLLEDGDE